MMAQDSANDSCPFEVIILAGGSSKRIQNTYKPLLKLENKPLIRWIVDRLSELSCKPIIVVHNESQKATLSNLVPDVRIIVDEIEIASPLIGALSGARVANSRIIFLMAVDQPFLSAEIISKIVNLCKDVEACIPRWPNGFIEPLAAAYDRKAFIRAAEASLDRNDLSLRSTLKMLKARFVDTYTLHPNPRLIFHNINTIDDYLKARNFLKMLHQRL